MFTTTEFIPIKVLILTTAWHCAIIYNFSSKYSNKIKESYNLQKKNQLPEL